MKKIFLSAIGVFCVACCFSQRLNKADEKLLQKNEDSLKIYAYNLLENINAENRFTADSLFTRMFVRTLKTSGSFYYPFTKLESISTLYPTDSSFRIFTWQLVVNDNLIRQHGAIQMRTADGSLKLFPLIDKSDVTDNLTDTIANNKGWIGAVYYKLLQTATSKQNIYTLLGYDENDLSTNRKIIEALSFVNEEPVFGGRYFSFEEDSVKGKTLNRYVMEYKKSAGARLTYDDNLNMIVFEHLESESNEPKKKYTLIPDGDYEGFKWKNNKWIHVEKVFNQITPEGQEPLPSPVKDAQGKTDEGRLKDNYTGKPTNKNKVDD